MKVSHCWSVSFLLLLSTSCSSFSISLPLLPPLPPSPPPPLLFRGLCPQGSRSSSSGTSTNARSSAASALGGINDGCLVRLKNGPPCGPGALVLSCSKVHGPRVGKTVNIIEHSSLDPRTTILVKVLRQDLRNESGSQVSQELANLLHGALPTTMFLDTSRLYEGLEVWKLSDVVFLDDSPAILGRVVAVDNGQAIVDIAYSHNSDKQGSSGMQSSLKVFRLSELEPCGVDVSSCFSPEGAPNGGSSGVHRGVSRHVAGIVQHHPICLLDPAPCHTPLLHSTEGSSSGHSMLHEFVPLAVHPTDNGPLLLVKRVSDGKAFLVSSSHLSSGLLQTSSFIAVNSHSHRPPCGTIEEEGCSALERGLMRNEGLWECMKAGDLSCPQQEVGRRRKIGAKKRKRKTEPRRMSSSCPTSQLAARAASFTDLHHSGLILLQDVHGIPIPIPPGFSLRTPNLPSPQLSHQGGREVDKQSPQVLTQAYTALVSRLHSHEDKGKKILLIVTGGRGKGGAYSITA